MTYCEKCGKDRKRTVVTYYGITVCRNCHKRNPTIKLISSEEAKTEIRKSQFIPVSHYPIHEFIQNGEIGTIDDCKCIIMKKLEKLK